MSAQNAENGIGGCNHGPLDFLTKTTISASDYFQPSRSACVGLRGLGDFRLGDLYVSRSRV